MRHRVVLSTIVMLTCLAMPAYAQTHVGVRAGVSADPDQFFFGGHIETEPLLERLSFRPNAEIGIGDDTTTIALNLEFVYSIPLENACINAAPSSPVAQQHAQLVAAITGSGFGGTRYGDSMTIVSFAPSMISARCAATRGPSPTGS